MYLIATSVFEIYKRILSLLMSIKLSKICIGFLLFTRVFYIKLYSKYTKYKSYIYSYKSIISIQKYFIATKMLQRYKHI